MPIVFGAIAPHGFPIIPDLSDDAEGGMATREAMLELGRRAKAAGVEAIVIASPHFFRIHDHIFLADVSRGAGTLHWDCRSATRGVDVAARAHCR